MCEHSHKATNLAIDAKLLDEAARTKKAAVTLALEEFIARRRQAKLRQLFGQLEWASDGDYKAERSRR
jgi:hypothetical protein